MDRQNRRIKELEEELDEYRKRYPSSIGIKNGKPYAMMEQKPSESKSVRKPGAQKGHEGHSRSVPRITERVMVKASIFTCPKCSSPKVRKGIRKRVIEGVPEIAPRVIQHRIERMYCRKCGKISEPDIPDAFPNARFSIRTMLIASYVKVAMRMSLENVSATMREVFGLRISEGEVQGMLYQLSDSLGQEYERLLGAIRNALSRNTDTTKWREGAEAWTFVTSGEAIFHVTGSNSHEVALDLLRKHRGTDIQDRFSTFETLASRTKNPQQYCWSHIICDAKELEEFYGDEGRIIKESQQGIHEEAKSFHGHGSTEDIDRLHDRMIFLQDSDYDHSRSRKFVDNLLERRKGWLFRFVVDPDVESTNNRAERAQ